MSRARWRSSVRAMADLMEEKLRKHDSERGEDGWLGDEPEALLERVREETVELAQAVADLQADRQCRNGPHYARVGYEAADVCNMAMMVADSAGALPDTTPESPGIALPVEGETPCTVCNGADVTACDEICLACRGAGTAEAQARVSARVCVGDRVGDATVVSFCDEPNTGMAVIEEARANGFVQLTRVPVWLLNLARGGTGAALSVDGERGPYCSCPACPGCMETSKGETGGEP